MDINLNSHSIPPLSSTEQEIERESQPGPSALGSLTQSQTLQYNTACMNLEEPPKYIKEAVISTSSRNTYRYTARTTNSLTNFQLSAPVSGSSPVYDTVVQHKSFNIERLNGCKIATPFIAVPSLAVVRDSSFEPHSNSTFLPPGMECVSESSAIFLPDLFFLNINPHSPPFNLSVPPAQNDGYLKSVRERGWSNSRSLSVRDGFSRTNDFTLYMEERILRWRPSTSNQGVDSTMSGTHPFQSGQYSQNLTIIKRLKDWWEKNKTSSNNNQPRENGDRNSTNAASDGFISSLNMADVLHRVAPHSSSSFILSQGYRSRNQSQVLGTGIIASEPGPTPNLEYTPLASPFNQFELAFDKSPPLLDTNRIDVTEGEEDLYELVSGMDNFLVSCIAQSWNGIKSLSC